MFARRGNFFSIFASKKKKKKLLFFHLPCLGRTCVSKMTFLPPPPHPPPIYNALPRTPFVSAVFHFSLAPPLRHPRHFNLVNFSPSFPPPLILISALEKESWTPKMRFVSVCAKWPPPSLLVSGVAYFGGRGWGGLKFCRPSSRSAVDWSGNLRNDFCNCHQRMPAKVQWERGGVGVEFDSGTFDIFARVSPRVPAIAYSLWFFASLCLWCYANIYWYQLKSILLKYEPIF